MSSNGLCHQSNTHFPPCACINTRRRTSQAPWHQYGRKLPGFPSKSHGNTVSAGNHTAVRNDCQRGASKNTPEGPKTNPAANVTFLEINSSTVVDRFPRGHSLGWFGPSVCRMAFGRRHVRYSYRPCIASSANARCHGSAFAQVNDPKAVLQRLKFFPKASLLGMTSRLCAQLPLGFFWFGETAFDRHNAVIRIAALLLRARFISMPAWILRQAGSNCAIQLAAANQTDRPIQMAFAVVSL
jgi:hypothetical protein